MNIDRTVQDQSISMNDDHGQTINKYLDDDDDENLYKSPVNHNDNSKTSNTNNNYINKTSSNSNVFSRLMHSEPHVSNI